MPTAKKPEVSAAELELKRRGRRRLIGALTLGALAVVILPMVFDSRPKKTDDPQNAKNLQNGVRQEINIQIPPKEGLPPLLAPVGPPSSVVSAPVASPPATASTQAQAQAPAQALAQAPKPAPIATVTNKNTPPASPASAPPKTVASVVPIAKPDVKPAAVSTPTPPKNGSIKSSAVTTGGYVVQIGAYKDADNAKAIIAQMKAAKLPVFSDSISVKTGSVTRVRLGPFSTKEKAEAALLEAKLGGLTGKVVPQ